jgi:hypothetical protein
MHLKSIGKKRGNGKAIPVTGCEDPYGCEMSRLPHFVQTIGSQMAVKLSALCSSHPSFTVQSQSGPRWQLPVWATEEDVFQATDSKPDLEAMEATRWDQ